MGIGHVAVGLGLKSAGRRVNAGLLLFAAFLADFLLGWFVLAGWESCEYPPDYASRHYMLFTFPWSHGLFPELAWGAGMGLLIWAVRRESRAAWLAAVAVVSHFLLDGLVHVKALPIAGSWELGLGLWRTLPAELAIEAVMTVAALVLYWRATVDHRQGRRIGMVVYVILLSAMSIGGQATATAPVARSTLVANWIAAPVVFSAIAWWLDRQPRLRR